MLILAGRIFRIRAGTKGKFRNQCLLRGSRGLQALEIQLRRIAPLGPEQAFSKFDDSLILRRGCMRGDSNAKKARWRAMFERYTEAAKRAIDSAQAEAMLHGAQAVSPAHLLVSLSRDESYVASRIAPLKDRIPGLCAQLGIPFHPSPPSPQATPAYVPFNNDSKIALGHAEKEANRDWSQHIDTDHVLRGLMRFSNEASEALKSSGIHLDGLRAAAKQHRIELPSAKASFGWLLKQMWRMAWPVVWRVGLLVLVAVAIVVAIHFIKK
jgi:hypothetical protein